MPNFFEEVKAAVIDDAALSQGDTSQCSCSVSQGLSPGPTLGRSLWQLLQPSWPALKPSAWLPTVLPESALPQPQQLLCSHHCPPPWTPSVSLNFTHSMLTWAPCFPLSHRKADSHPSPPTPASTSPHLPVPPLNPCGLMVQTGHNSSDSTWLSNYLVSDALYTRLAEIPRQRLRPMRPTSTVLSTTSQPPSRARHRPSRTSLCQILFPPVPKSPAPAQTCTKRKTTPGEGTLAEAHNKG